MMGKTLWEKIRNQKQIIGGVLSIGFAAVFLCSTYLLLSSKLAEKREETAFDQLIEQIYADSGDETTAIAPSAQEGLAEKEADTENKYQALFEKNRDFAGWLCINDTKINYPVMRSPDDDPEYYLHRAFDGSKSKSGIPFLGKGSPPDANNILVYGHNMKNGTMFADLLQYADADFAATHSVIRFDTLTAEAAYELVAAFYSRVYAVDESGVFRYYNYGGELDEDTFTQYIENVRQSALYDTGISPSYGDKLLTLSTCSYHTGDGRFVVVARKVR